MSTEGNYQHEPDTKWASFPSCLKKYAFYEKYGEKRLTYTVARRILLMHNFF